MEFKRISEAHTHGYRAIVGDRTAEVLRSFPGDWFVFAKIDRLVCKAWEGSHGTYPQALAAAKRFLNHEVTPDVWPNKAYEVQSSRTIGVKSHD